MDPEIKECLTAFFKLVWDIFVNTELPYFNITFGQIYIGLFASSVFATFVHKTLDSETRSGSKHGDYVSKGEKEND